MIYLQSSIKYLLDASVQGANRQTGFCAVNVTGALSLWT